MKKKLKGFTLVELIIVLAIFAIIMFSAVQLLDPVSKFFVRSSNFENTTACVDNMRRCIEGNLRYVNRVRAYSGYIPYAEGATSAAVNTAPTPSAVLTEQVKKFYTTFFSNRKFIDTSGSIYVLVFDNTKLISDENLAKNYGTINDFVTAYGNSGKIVQFEYKFDNYDSTKDEWDEVAATCVAKPWLVNQKLYGAFEYRFELGDISVAAPAPGPAPDPSEEVKDEEGRTVTFNPQDFTISIHSSEIRRQDGGLIRMLSTDKNTSSFSMKNVLDGTKKYASPLMDQKTLCVDESANDHVYTVEEKTRYANIDANPTTDDIQDCEHLTGTKFDGFYFIYTVPDSIHSNDSGFAKQAAPT